MIRKNSVNSDTSSTEDYLRNFILTDNKVKNEVNFTDKPPVPLPRKSKSKVSDSSSEKSDKTFSISSPKILNLHKERRVSVDSHATFSIENEKIQIQSEEETQAKPIGDIVIHNSPSNTNLIRVVKTKETKNVDDLSSFDEHTYNVNEDLNNTNKFKNMYGSLESSEDIYEEDKIIKKSSPSKEKANGTPAIEKNVLSIGGDKNGNHKNIPGIFCDANENAGSNIGDTAENNKNGNGKETTINNDRQKLKMYKTTSTSHIDNAKLHSRKSSKERSSKKYSSSSESTPSKDIDESEETEKPIKNKKSSKEIIVAKKLEDFKNVTELLAKSEEKLRNNNEESSEDLEENFKDKRTKTRTRKFNTLYNLMKNKPEKQKSENLERTKEIISEDQKRNGPKPLKIRHSSTLSRKKESDAISLESSIDELNRSHGSFNEIKSRNKPRKNKNKTIVSSDEDENPKQYKQKKKKQVDNKTTSDSDETSDSQRDAENKGLNKNQIKSTKPLRKDFLNGLRRTKSKEDIEMKEIKTSSRTKIKKKSIKDKNLDNESNCLLSYEYFMGVVIYKTDHLLLNSFINHPIVKVHIVDLTTGEYIKRSKMLADDKSTDEYLSPMITKAFDLAEKRSLIPYWEEMLIFQEDFDYLIQYHNNVIIFFEILDFLSFQSASVKYTSEGTNSGWYKVAWAFLKPIGKNEHLNTEIKLRLQLYKTKKYIKHKLNTCYLFDWWNSKNLVKYPSSLHICIKKVKSEFENTELGLSKDKSEKLLRVKDEINEHILLHESNDIKTQNILLEKLDKGSEKRIWTRINGQSCKVPNRILYKLKTGEKGCVKLKFSNNGLFLAYGSASETNFLIYILNVSTGNQYIILSGHFGLIYDLHWSSNDKYLVSASADRTVNIWDIANKCSTPLQILPHPSFVYSSQFNPKHSEIITGSYDKIIRVWRPNGDYNFDLVEELEKHEGYITAICFGKNGTSFYSSDCLGAILEWYIQDDEWSLQRTFKFSELKSTAINWLQLHPGGKRLFICCRDSVHRMVDLSVGCIVQWFRGALNYRLQLTASISPCGNLIISPSEDGTLFIWDTDTGSLQTTFTSYPCKTRDTVIPYCVQYHPYDHMLAVGHHGVAVSIIISVFEKKNSNLQELSIRNLITDENVQGDRSAEKKLNKKEKKREALKREVKNVNLETIIEKLDEVIVSARGE